MTALAKTAGPASRSLIGHSLDVAHAARAILSAGTSRARLSTIAGLALTDVHVDRIAVLIGLHDFGKATVGFQDRICGRGRGCGHVAEALAALQAGSPLLLNAVRADLLAAWFCDPDAALYAVLCHHGGPVDHARIDGCMATADADLAADGEYDPIAEIGALSAALLAAFPLALRSAPPIPASTRLEHALAGLTMLADWMGSTEAWFPLDGPDDRPEAARRLLADTAWCSWHSGAAAIDLLGGLSPRMAQAVMLLLPTEHRLVVLEASTGTGKTEAAVLWCDSLAAAGLVDGLYFAVPTRSAATELHARIAAMLARAHPALAGKIVRAVPGMLDTDRPISMHDEITTSTWALGSSRKVMAAPVCVGTIDQALLSQMRVRHGWLRAACLTRHLLVVDEVHASDVYMGEIVTRLVREHVAAGGYALLMSATLGETMRARIEGRPRLPYAEASMRPYPLITTSGASVRDAAPPVRAMEIELLHEDAVLRLACTEAHRGAAVLMIRSTVADAVAAYRALHDTGTDVLLHHSRYADHDRRILDDHLLGIVGRHGKRRGCIIVATQTAEQSLDIDADLLITDACPADVLLQRLGRLHRHRVGTVPLCVMIDPGPWDRYVTAVGRQIGRDGQGWAWVYSALAVRETVEWLRMWRRIVVPTDVRRLVERATHVDYLEARAESYGPAWSRLWTRLYGKDLASRQAGSAVLVDRDVGYDRAIVDPDAATRLRDSRIDVTMRGLVSPFDGARIPVLPIRAAWLRGVPPGTVGMARGRIIMIGTVRVRYSREGIMRMGA